MNKHKQNEVLKQPELMPYSEALSHLDPRVRTTYIGGEQFISVLDILQYHGNKKNPTQAWKTTLSFLEKQGRFLYYEEHKFNGQGQKPTPIIRRSDAKGLIEMLSRIIEHAKSKTVERRDIHPAVAAWLTKNDYRYIHEYELADYGVVDFFAKHSSGHRLLVEAKGSQNPIRAIFQVIAYGVQVPDAKLAIASPKQMVTPRCLLIAAKYNVLVILL
jgi:hypothetical protein